MNLIEALFILSVITVGASGAFSKRTPYGESRYTPWTIGMAFSGIFWFALIMTERRSWRMDPAFVAIMAIFIIGLNDRSRRRKARLAADKNGVKNFTYAEPRLAVVARRSAGVFGMAMAIASLAAALIFPVRNLPAPTGRYLVGTASFELVDETRTGVYLDAPGTPRRILAQAWYPADSSAASMPRAQWIADVPVANAYADYVGLPHWIMSQLPLILTNSRQGAAAAADTGAMPVVVISHGWTGTRAMHTALAEELASRGLVAIVIDHPYGALSVSFADGTVMPLHRAALPDRETTQEFDRLASALVATYAADIAAVVRGIRAGSTVPQLAGRLDTSRIALAGHSTGGGAAVLAALDDPAYSGVVGLDAWVEPIGKPRLAAGLATPQLHIGSASWTDGINAGYLATLKQASGSWAGYRIPGSSHFDFAMVRHVTSVGSWIGLAGKGSGFTFARTVTPLACDWLEAIFREGKDAAFADLPELGRE